MHSLYKGLDQKKFLKRSAILLLVADLLSFSSLYYKWTATDDLIEKVMQELGKQTMQQVSQEFLEQMITLFHQCLTLMLVLIILYHAGVYYFYSKKSYLPHKYVNFSAITSFFGFTLYLLMRLTSFHWYDILIIASLALYAYQSFAPKDLRKTKTEEE